MDSAYPADCARTIATAIWRGNRSGLPVALAIGSRRLHESSHPAPGRAIHEGAARRHAGGRTLLVAMHNKRAKSRKGCDTLSLSSASSMIGSAAPIPESVGQVNLER